MTKALKTGMIGPWVRMVFGTGGPTTVGRLIGGCETPMDIAHGEREGDGGTQTKGMKANAMASTESMKVKAMASTEGTKVEAMVRAEGMAAVEVEAMAVVGVEVEAMAEGKI
jgi:hypothetical protein